MKKIFNLFIMILLIGSLATLTTSCKGESTQTTDEDGYTVLESGLKFKDIVVGKGTTAKAGDTLSMHYTGTLEDGSKFDSSVDRGIPFEFTLGTGQVIEGWDVGVDGMKVGGKRELVLPPEMAYGSMALPGIPANSTLLFDVELMEIK